MARNTGLSARERSDMATLLKFVHIYCRARHEAEKTPFTFRGLDSETLGARPARLCPDCTRLMKYALTMRLKCPHDPKPMCKKCATPCYHEDYRRQIREIMKFSGLYLIKHGRLDLIYHYFR
jgi:hypothetical protein